MNGNNWRERIAWIAVAVGAGTVLLSLVELVREAHVLHAGVERAALSVGGQSLPAGVLVAMTAAAVSCGLAQPATPAAARVLRSASVVAVASAVLETLFVVLGLLSPEGRDGLGVLAELLGAALSVALKLAAAAVMRHVAGSLPARAPRTSTAGAVASGTPAVASAEGARATGQPSGVAPTWSPDQAMGTVWNRAGDAATGAAGRQEAASASWQPPRTTPALPDADAAAGPVTGPASTFGTPTPPRSRSAWTTAADLARGEYLPAGDGGAVDPGAPRTAPVWRASDE